MQTKDAKFMPLPTWLYILGWFFFLYLFIQLLTFTPSSPSNIILTGMYFLDFGVHEASHLAVGFLPHVWVAMAGSAGEIGFTFLLFYATRKGKTYFASAFTGLWIMLAFRSVGRYMADARSQLLELIGPGETVTHDWNYVFGQLNLLNYDTIIGGIFAFIGNIIGFLALCYGAYLIYAKLKKPAKNNDSLVR